MPHHAGTQSMAYGMTIEFGHWRRTCMYVLATLTRIPCVSIACMLEHCMYVNRGQARHASAICHSNKNQDNSPQYEVKSRP